MVNQVERDLLEAVTEMHATIMNGERIEAQYKVSRMNRSEVMPDQTVEDIMMRNQELTVENARIKDEFERLFGTLSNVLPYLHGSDGYGIALEGIRRGQPIFDSIVTHTLEIIREEGERDQ